MCLIPSGITRSDCGYSFGGLAKVFLANKDYVTVGKNAQDVVTGFTFSNSEKFYEFGAEPETAQLLEELQTGNASKFINQTLNFSLIGITQEKKEVLEKLGLAKIMAIVQLQDNSYKLAGEFGSGLKATTLTIDTGTANADANGATISLVGGSTGFANQVIASAVSAAIA
jgi:hypothetical protein